MTYDSLYNNILDYLERNDEQTIAQVPNFIMLAEQVIASQIKFLGNLTVNESTMVVGQNVIPKPARWHKTVSMNVTVGTINQPVFLRKYEYLKEYAPDSTAVGTPKYYGDYDYTHWLVAPTPDVAYSFEVLYYERVQPLDATNQSNWFTVYAPQAMLYGSLLQQGKTLALPLLDAPIVVDSGKYNEWRPSNAEEDYTGKFLDMNTAVQHSINLCAAYAITHYTVPDSVVAFAHQLGIQSQVPSLPSIALGTGEVSPLEMASAFSVFATEGTYAKPFAILKIEDKNGNVYYNGNTQTSVVLDSATAYLMTLAMEKVINGGTAASVRKYYKGFGAGKTGTTQNYTDAWFVGFNRGLTTSIWIGYDNPSRKLGGGYQYGGSACGPIWGRMNSAIARYYRSYNADTYARPESVKDIELCLDSGELATTFCTHKGFYPVNMNKPPPECTLHSPK